MGKRRRVPERRGLGRRPALTGLLAAVALAGLGAGGYVVFGDGAFAAGSVQSAEDRRRAPLTAADVSAAAETFLAAWQKGDVARAAKATSDPEAARVHLAGWTEEARITGAVLTAGRPKGDGLTFAVKATVTHEELTEPLAYDSALTVVRRAADGKPVVEWRPAVLHPELKDDERLLTGEAGTAPVKALDRDGGELTAEAYPSVAPMLKSLAEKYGKKSGGTGAIALRAVPAEVAAAAGKNGDTPPGGKKDAKSEKDRKKAEGRELLRLAEATPGEVRTTLHPGLQKLAEEKVAAKPRSSVVLLRASTGEILAAANAEPGLNTAFQGSLAPGSTMKVISSALLLEKGLASNDREHPCPKYSSYGGWKFQNDDKFAMKDATFKASFARSCNTAFISQAEKLPDDALTREAQEVFGLGLDNWAVGVSTFDGGVPVQSAAPKAASLIGQGGVRMNPLNMASVSATVSAGSFHQPYLVPPTVDDRALARPARTMSSGVLGQLRELMRYTAQAGTAAEAMAGLGPSYGAKTGTAEVDGQDKPNGWFTAYRGDYAAAAVVRESGHGGENAGPLVAALLGATG
ncbi:penicillin-binding transpeptidase domain-containing protein [Streptomyces fragilis]|uniref:Penicillin-binding transpeptidase domain-containing protein n=1 Tax=Streptomyces fragilis TaxID=67301 RepID=A0ABV2YFX9_9ACTN|nr:penicillin-binding transpeptidase domain-containing protein [Streptomyces fragilis]